MRTIKFRAWDKKAKFMDYNMTFAGNISKDMNNAPGIGDGEDYSELMQFTGLTDKNGKEIFEGDIVRMWGGAEWNGCFEYDYRGVCEFSYGEFCIKQGDLSASFSRGDNLEVIGNIYEL